MTQIKLVSVFPRDVGQTGHPRILEGQLLSSWGCPEVPEGLTHWKSRFVEPLSAFDSYSPGLERQEREEEAGEFMSSCQWDIKF